MVKYHPRVVFESSVQTGSGEEQSITHGLGVTPNHVFIQPATGATYTEGTHTAHVCKFTVQNTKTYYVVAFYKPS